MTPDPRSLVERLTEDAKEIAGWGAGNEAARVREAAATITRLTEEAEGLRKTMRDMLEGRAGARDAARATLARSNDHV